MAQWYDEKAEDGKLSVCKCDYDIWKEFTADMQEEGLAISSKRQKHSPMRIVMAPLKNNTHVQKLVAIVSGTAFGSELLKQSLAEIDRENLLKYSENTYQRGRKLVYVMYWSIYDDVELPPLPEC